MTEKVDDAVAAAIFTYTFYSFKS